MNNNEFRQHAHVLVDWIADYYAHIEQLRVTPDVLPGDIARKLPALPPENGTAFTDIFADFEQIIFPGMTHWQHPSFHAYFPANTSPPSVLAEILTAAMGAQCMVWQTSPAATELEERVMEWIARASGLPTTWQGVIQETASAATLCALLTARECATDFVCNKHGLQGQKQFAVYCSSETHSSLEKAIKIAGLGSHALRKLPVDNCFAVLPNALQTAIEQDLTDGIIPLMVVANIGTTSSTAIDPVRQIGELCQKYRVWLHVDAAFAGSAAFLPEMRSIITDGLELADSYVFNPHKWLFTNFDCSAYYVKDKAALLRTFEIMPEYLKTGIDAQVNNYRDWGLPLGRRFRALKLWFVLRSYGTAGIAQKLREHLRLAQIFAQQISEKPNFEVLAPIPLNLVCFRHVPPSLHSNLNEINEHNAQLLKRVNEHGEVFLTHTKLGETYAIRAVFGQTNVAEKHVDKLLAVIERAVLQG